MLRVLKSCSLIFPFRLYFMRGNHTPSFPRSFIGNPTIVDIYTVRINHKDTFYYKGFVACSPHGVHFLRAQKTNQKRAPDIALIPKSKCICGVIANSLTLKHAITSSTNTFEFWQRYDGTTGVIRGGFKKINSRAKLLLDPVLIALKN